RARGLWIHRDVPRSHRDRSGSRDPALCRGGCRGGFKARSKACGREIRELRPVPVASRPRTPYPRVVTAPSQLAADLAREIRQAVSETAPPTSVRTSTMSSGEEESARISLDRAAANITPAIPSGARFSVFKRFALRALRFLWRDQAAFNALTLEALQAILAGLASQRKAVAQFDGELARFRE